MEAGRLHYDNSLESVLFDSADSASFRSSRLTSRNWVPSNPLSYGSSGRFYCYSPGYRYAICHWSAVVRAYPADCGRLRIARSISQPIGRSQVSTERIAKFKGISDRVVEQFLRVWFVSNNPRFGSKRSRFEWIRHRQIN